MLTDRVPLFIVGMPRNGTKLLRDLITNHKDVAIPHIETECLPAWYARYSNSNFSDRSLFLKFYTEATGGAYFMHQKRAGIKVINENEWFERSKKGDIGKVFEELIKHDVEWKNGQIWGDKSPSYINHLELINKLYPNAKVILIVRDVRDYCLSINKAWGKNIYRAAQRWYDSITEALFQIDKLGNNGLCLKYEDLINDPKTQMQLVCKFIDVPFDDNILKLSNPSENIGDAKGRVEIVASNFGKWKKHLSTSSINQIESYTWPLLQKLNYETTHYHSDIKRLSNAQNTLYKLLDGYNLVMTKNSSGRKIIWNIRFYFRNMIDQFRAR